MKTLHWVTWPARLTDVLAFGFVWGNGMALSYNLLGRSADPVDYLANSENDRAMAIITGVEGPSYRPIGALMAIGSNGERVGTLSSGCIENDLVLHAGRVIASGSPDTVLYGVGSPFIDIRLPCGGSLEILLLPNPDRDALNELRAKRDVREPARLEINRETGQLRVAGQEEPKDPVHFYVDFEPEIRFITFGKGPEAATFSAMAHSVGYPGALYSPDEETLKTAQASGCETFPLDRAAFPSDLDVDPWTAVICFFHDHEWEAPILATVLDGPALYVGAQGSRKSAEARAFELKSLGVSAAGIERLHGPVGLIPSARDARTLAVGVLAEVLGVARVRRETFLNVA